MSNQKTNVIGLVKSTVMPKLSNRDRSQSTILMGCNMDQEGLPAENIFVIFGRMSDRMALVDLMLAKLHDLKEQLLDEVDDRTPFFKGAGPKIPLPTQDDHSELQEGNILVEEPSDYDQFMKRVKRLF